MSRKQSMSMSSDGPHMYPVGREPYERAAAYYGDMWREFGVETREDAYRRDLKIIDSMSRGRKGRGKEGGWSFFQA